MNMEITQQENMEVIEQLTVERELQPSTRRNYTNALTAYIEVTGKTLRELLDEAEEEEEKGVRWKKRKVKQYLIKYRNHLFQNYLKTSAKQYLTLVKTFYTHFEIELQPLPKVSEKNLKENPPIQFEDIPTRKLLKDCCNASKPVLKAIILFMSSSGCARMETLNITIGDFIEATSDYHHGGSITQILSELEEQDDIVPTFHIRRQKTNKYYYTFCSPEATKSIIQYLKSRVYYCETKGTPLTMDSGLFHVNGRTFSRYFRRLNNSLSLGRKGNRNNFTSHMLRKYHATTLNNLPYFKDSEINFLQGRVPEKVTGIYLQQDPKILREKYIQCLNHLQVFWDATSITIESDEYKKVVKENDNLKNVYNENMSKLEKIEKLLSSKSDEEWLDLLNQV